MPKFKTAAWCFLKKKSCPLHRRPRCRSIRMQIPRSQEKALGTSHKAWQLGEKLPSKFCFIGKNLDKAEMIKDLQACMFDAF